MIVQLEQVTIADKALLREWRNSSEVSRWMYTNHHISKLEHSAWFDQMLKNEATKYWKIVVDELPVGTVSLSEIDLVDQTCAWAIYLGESSAMGQGIAQAACLLSLNFAFHNLKIQVVRCEAIAENTRALGLYEQVGFVPITNETQVVRRGESNLAIVKLELSDSAWESSKNALHQILKEKGVSLDEH